MTPTLQTSVDVVVFPTPGGPDNKAALHPDPSSLNLLTEMQHITTHINTLLVLYICILHI